MVLNDDQREYAEYMASLPRDERCKCGWYQKDECPPDCYRAANVEAMKSCRASHRRQPTEGGQDE